MTNGSNDIKDKKQSSLDFLTHQIDIWNRTATKKKRTISRWRKRMFFLILFGTFCGLFSQQVTSGINLHIAHALDLPEILAILSVIAIALATFAGSQILSSELEKDQIKARAASEALKVQAYLYLMNAPPFNRRDREKVLYKRIEMILKDVSNSTPDLEVVYDPKSFAYKFNNICTFGQLSRDRKKEVWIQTFDMDMTFKEYVEERVNGQINGYYLKKAGEFQLILNRGKAWTLIFGFMGVAVGSIAATSEFEISMWIAFLTTAGASIGSYLASNRYEYLMLSYVSTAGQLELVAAKYKSMESPTIKAQELFVAQTETIFAMEHNAWITEIASAMDEDEEGEEGLENSTEETNK